MSEDIRPSEGSLTSNSISTWKMSSHHVAIEHLSGISNGGSDPSHEDGTLFEAFF